MTNEKIQEGKFEILEDGRFPWLERRLKVVELAQVFERAYELFQFEQYHDYALRAGSCATWLKFNRIGDKKSLSAANFCQLRLCPMCTARRAKRAAYKLSQIMDWVQSQYHCRFVFLTLTVKNVQGEELGEMIGHLCRSWDRLMKHRDLKRLLIGWFRAVEITRNAERQDYHPHIHAILAVPEDYKPQSKKWITQAEWTAKWRLAARLDYKPIVDVRLTKGHTKSGDNAASGEASVEAAKYPVKDVDYIDPDLSSEQAAQIVHHYTQALYRRRMMAFGGAMKEAARLFDAEGLETSAELVHVGDDYIRDDVAEVVEFYGWHLGVGNYVLAKREINPLFLKEDGVSPYEMGYDEG